MQPIDRHVGQRIQLRREVLGYDHVWLAEQLGYTARLIGDWEAGRVRVGGAQLFQLAGLLNVPLTWFFEELPADLAETDLHEKPLLISDAIALLYAQAPRADPPLGARMLRMARSLEQTASHQDRISRQVMTELNQLLSQWKRPAR